MDYPDPWPLRHLVLRTPRLELRPDDDAGVLEAVDEIYHGVHDPGVMPFGLPWTDAPRAELGRNSVQHFWRRRAELGPQRWSIAFLVRVDGRVVGVQDLAGVDFAVRREVTTGSWLGRRHQGTGIGTEMRAAVLQFAFDHLGAVQARSCAWQDNGPSLGVSRKLGYVPDGTRRLIRRGEPTVETRLLLTADRFRAHRPQWNVEVRGLDGCRSLLGLPSPMPT